jgi:hypothetical protein
MFKALECILSFMNHTGSYLLNDPTTPDLSEIIPIPPKGLLNFSVLGMPEKFEPKNSSEKRSLNCHVIIGNCLNNIQKYCKTPINKWSATNNLSISPTAGRDLNAFYNRQSLKFFYYPHAGKNVYFSDSADIVAHELGHAFLDAMRPDFWSVQSLEIWSFHEAFSDIVAMFNLMSYDKAIKVALNQTKGNMEESNVISRLAEEVGAMIRDVTRDPAYLPNALRDPALEHFNYVNPATLPSEAPNNMLAAECHSFGRVFSSAWYAMFVGFFKMHLESSNPIEAFKLARDAAFSIVMHAIPVSPRVDKYYSAMAKSMLIIGNNKNEKYGQIISSVFSERNILQKEEFNSNFAENIRHKVISSLSKQDSVLKTAKSTLVCLRSNKFFEIRDLPIASSMSLDNSIKVEIPYDTYYEFNDLGEVVDAFAPEDQESKDSAAFCLLKIADQIGPGKMWSIQEGVLTRQYVK